MASNDCFPFSEPKRLTWLQNFSMNARITFSVPVTCALAVPLVATTGERLDDMPADYGEKVCHAQDVLLELILPGAVPPVDIFPILKYVPEILAKWKAHARYVRKCMVDDADNYLIGAKKMYGQMVRGPDSVGFDSLLPKIMKEQAGASGKKKFTDTELAFVGQASVGAAVDTTLPTFKNLMIAFAAFPEIMAKAQQELDRVAGDEPLTSDKLGELIYLKACVSEVRDLCIIFNSIANN
jgi:hypothetical protein